MQEPKTKSWTITGDGWSPPPDHVMSAPGAKTKAKAKAAKAKPAPAARVKAAAVAAGKAKAKAKFALRRPASG